MVIDSDSTLRGFLYDLVELRRNAGGVSPRFWVPRGASVAGYVIAYDESSVVVEGGDVGLDVVATDSGVVEIHEGCVGGVNSSLNGRATVCGGRVGHELFVGSGGTIHWTGGMVAGPIQLVTARAEIHIYGSRLHFGQDDTVRGELRDGTRIEAVPYKLSMGAKRAQIILHDATSRRDATCRRRRETVEADWPADRSRTHDVTQPLDGSRFPFADRRRLEAEDATDLGRVRAP